MSDWDDDDFEAPTVFDASAGPAVNAKFEDEEDLALTEEVVLTGPASEALASANAKKAAAEDARLALQLNETLLENETPEERKMRLRKQIEESDAQNTADLFGGVGETNAAPKAKAANKSASGGSGMGGFNLKNKQDHVNFAISMSQKLQKSTPFCLAAFYSELNGRLAGNLDAAALTSAITLLTTLHDEKKKKEDATAAPPQKKKATKHEKAMKERKHADMFGGGFDQKDEYEDQYGGMEDDYMF